MLGKTKVAASWPRISAIPVARKRGARSGPPGSSPGEHRADRQGEEEEYNAARHRRPRFSMPAKPWITDSLPDVEGVSEALARCGGQGPRGRLGGWGKPW